MKKSEELPKLAVVKEEILMPKSTISDIKIVDRNITSEENKKREQLKNYAKFFYHQISDIEDLDDDTTEEVESDSNELDEEEINDIDTIDDDNFIDDDTDDDLADLTIVDDDELEE